MCITQDGPANALAHNKDYTQVVIAGRNGKNYSLYLVLCDVLQSHKQYHTIVIE